VKRLLAAALLVAGGCHLLLGYDGLDFDGDGGAAGASEGGGGQGGGGSEQGGGGQGGGGQGGGGQGGGGQGGGGTGGGCDPLVLDPPDAGGMGGDGGGCAELLPESDDFEDPTATAARWNLSFPEPADTTLEMCSGELRLTVEGQHYWGAGETSPIVHQRVCGDFGMIVRARAQQPDGSPLVGTDDGAGLILVDPNDNLHWLIYAFTFDVSPGTAIYHGSTLALGMREDFRGFSDEGLLMVCRAEGDISFYRIAGDAVATPQWTGMGDYGMPCCLDVGIAAAPFVGNEDVRGTFEYVTFHDLSTQAACVNALNAAR
jgi:hypothetical protein